MRGKAEGSREEQNSRAISKHTHTHTHTHTKQQNNSNSNSNKVPEYSASTRVFCATSGDGRWRMITSRRASATGSQARPTALYSWRPCVDARVCVCAAVGDSVNAGDTNAVDHTSLRAVPSARRRRRKG